ncbi:MAG TPA: DUF373 family protein, partial [Candidatus Binatia bacterium]|nr:DUF373 family protein [Candidatus Binatia bacterium]
IRLIVDNPRYARMALGLPGILVLIFGILWGINNFVYPGAIYYYGIAFVIVLGGFLLLKGFGVDRATKDFYKWAKDYTPPSLPMQISNYTIIAGILCIAVSVYLGVANVNINVAPASNFAGWINIIPRIAYYFITGIIDLLIAGAIIVLLGRSVRLYFERNSRLLRNIALIVSVAWSRWILVGTANVIIYYYNKSSTVIGITDPIFSNFLFTIIVGILIGVASVLLIYIVNRQAKGFFKKREEKEEEL